MIGLVLDRGGKSRDMLCFYSRGLGLGHYCLTWSRDQDSFSPFSVKFIFQYGSWQLTRRPFRSHVSHWILLLWIICCHSQTASFQNTVVLAEGNGDLQTLICVLVARPRPSSLTLSNPVPWQNWMVAYLGYTLRMKTLFCGWPIMVNDTHTRRRRFQNISI